MGQKEEISHRVIDKLSGGSDSFYMNALSRREEETLVKTTKARALKACDSVVKEFAQCAQGRTLSVAWACRDKYKSLQGCMLQYTGPEAMEIVRKEYLRLRDQNVVPP